MLIIKENLNENINRVNCDIDDVTIDDISKRRHTGYSRKTTKRKGNNMADKELTVSSDSDLAKADLNGDGHLSQEELDMHLEFKRKELEDQDAMRDAKRSMTWFSLRGMIAYPVVVLVAELAQLNNAVTTLGGMAAVYFSATAAIVMAYFGADAYQNKK